jgi:pyruvate/2-oxoglutarate dehydrogenase complex dihydrolipoamide acyltransferase (E2) component
MNSLEETIIIAPEIGADDQPVRLSCWLVDVGDEVNIGDRIVELVMSGITFDISAEVSGVLSKILVTKGSEIQAGMSLGQIRIEQSDSEGN